MTNTAEGDGNQAPRVVSLAAIAEAMNRQSDAFLAALSDMRDPLLRADAVDRALNATTQLLLVMQVRSLFYERVHGVAGPPADPSDADAGRKAIIEEMATIMGRLVRPAFGQDHIASGALFNDCSRWLEGHEGDTFRPVGHANPITPDFTERNHRHVAVLMVKLIGAIKGDGRERRLIESIPSAPSYDVFLKWQRTVPADSRERMRGWGERARTARAAGGDQAAGHSIVLTMEELRALQSHERAAFQHYEEEGEAALAKLFAWVGRSGNYQGRSSRHGK